MLRSIFIVVFILICIIESKKHKRKRKRKKSNPKPSLKPTTTNKKSSTSVILTLPSTNSTTSTKISFNVKNPHKLQNLQVDFNLNGRLIKNFESSYFNSKLQREISLDISNIPKDAQHNISVSLHQNNEILSTSSQVTWILDDWRELSAAAAAAVCQEGDEFCNPTVQTRQTPFSSSVANIFNKKELASIRKLTKSKHTLYTPTTVGEIEHVDGEYRRTQKLIIGRNKVTEWIYKRLEDVAKTINEKYWKFQLGTINHQDYIEECRIHESLQFLLYKASENGFYDWHIDRGISAPSSLRKLSMTVQLSNSEEYVGGTLELKTGRDIVATTKLEGSSTIFPSYILHRVTPVTKGEREAIVIWFTGCRGFQ